MKIFWRLIAIILFLAAPLTYGQASVLGKWKTIDDKTGETKSIVELFDQQGKVFGKIIRLFPKPGDDQDPVCDKCDEADARYKKKIIGMEILRDMSPYGSEFVDGNILDPESGRVYRCKIWIENKDLKVRGYWGPVWRTQTWKRVD